MVELTFVRKRLPLVSDAAFNGDRFARHGVLAVSIIGNPGCGKTSLIVETAKRLRGEYKVGAVIVNPTAQRDARRLTDECGCPVRQITDARLDPLTLRVALEDMSLCGLDVLLIEGHAAAGGDERPPVHDLGETARVGVFSAAAGDDKAAEFPQQVEAADLVLLTKSDLLPHLRYDVGAFRRDVRRDKPGIELIELSPVSGEGMDRWIDWLKGGIEERRAEASRRAAAADMAEAAGAEWFVG
jgi:hydrogenase nickel incorporation protein HypB